ncbi:MAG: DUF4912 domain-containing protein [bacterium]|nr:MAG: DUF4912 domain-containing protein [bacterium]
MMATKNYAKLTKNELIELARKKKVSVTANMRKAEIIAALETAAGTKQPARKKAVSKKASPAKTRPAPGRAKKAAAKAEPSRTKRAAVKAAAPKGKKKAKVAAPKRAKKKTEEAAPKRAAAKPVARRVAPKPPAARVKRIAAETIRQKAEAGKYYLGAEEKAMPPVEAIDVPAGYGMDRIVTMVRDPHWIFTYWEVTEERYRGMERLFGSDWPDCRTVIRVFDLGDMQESHFDIEITIEARNWYINVSPSKRYQVAIGVLGPDGRFEQIAISNVVETPRAGISDVVDDRWMIPEELFERIFAASGGHDMHAASAELRALLERRLMEEISSGAVSSLASAAPPRAEWERGFRLWVATEVILYGATEPDATVAIQGKEIKLRGDGTFSIRFALPDGKIDIPVTAVSADKAEERTIDTTVNKKSAQKEPVLR